jgi:hypothetical protein
VLLKLTGEIFRIFYALPDTCFYSSIYTSMKLYDIAFYLVNVAMFSYTIPVAAGMYYLKELSKPLKILLAGLCVVLLLDLLLLFLDNRITNSLVYLFSMVDVLTIAFMYYFLINKRSVAKVMLVTGILFVLLIAVDACFISGLNNNGYSNALEKIFVLVTAVYFLSQLLQEDTETNILKQPVFWVSIAVIANNLVGSFDVFRGPVMNYSQNLYLQYYIFWSLITVCMNIAFAYAFRLCKGNIAH